MSKPTIAIDFDGTLHQYTGWHDGRIGDPNPGAVEFVTEAVKHFTVVVVSSRCNHTDGKQQIAEWMEKHGFPAEVTVWASRPPAWVSIDDRAWQFRGQWPTIEELQAFQPWWKADG